MRTMPDSYAILMLTWRVTAARHTQTGTWMEGRLCRGWFGSKRSVITSASMGMPKRWPTSCGTCGCASATLVRSTLQHAVYTSAFLNAQKAAQPLRKQALVQNRDCRCIVLDAIMCAAAVLVSMIAQEPVQAFCKHASVQTHS